MSQAVRQRPPATSSSPVATIEPSAPTAANLSATATDGPSSPSTTDGGLTVSHSNGHGTATLPADYVREHVRLGYAATAHGHQGDTVDIGLALVNEATSHRSLYVGAHRGRQENRLLVVADDTKRPRDVLERVLTNERADVPAVVQRRNLAEQVPRTHVPENPVATARRDLEDIRREVDPLLEPLRMAQAETNAAEVAVQREQLALAGARVGDAVAFRLLYRTHPRRSPRLRHAWTAPSKSQPPISLAWRTPRKSSLVLSGRRPGPGSPSGSTG